MQSPDVFRLRAADIRPLSPEAFNDFVNRLLRAEVNTAGLSPVILKTSDEIDTADLGIDAYLDGPDRVWTPWLPPGRLALQYKSGALDPADIKREFAKKGVQEVIFAGGGYAIFCTADYTPSLRQARERTLEECFQAAGLTPAFRFLTASDIAHFSERHQSLALLHYFGRPLSGLLLRFDDWAGLPPHQVPFEPDASRRTIIAEIEGALGRADGPDRLRVEGLPGVGKTRLALESLRGPGLAERVLYVQTPDDVPGELFAWIRQNEHATLVLVVDECSRERAEQLGNIVHACTGRLRLITVGPAEEIEGRSPVGFYRLDRLGDEELARIVSNVGLSFTREAIAFVLRMASGYVKLATAIAEALVTNRDLAAAIDFTGAPAVTQVLRALLPTNIQRTGMQGLALLRRVGMEEEVQVEGRAVADFMGISWPELAEVAREMGERGLVVRQGRYRYVTPHLLAIWLAAEVLSARREEVIRLIKTFPTEDGRTALADRLGDLGGDNFAKKVVDELLSSRGVFQQLSDLDDRVGSELFGKLAKASPLGALSRLEDLLGSLGEGELKNFVRGRRQTVWTLERLAWRPETFDGAARLLLALAEAENESYANNASGVWVGLFKTFLGGTAVSAFERHALLREILSDSRPHRRTLAVRALKNALSVYETRVGGAEDQGGWVTSTEWRPSSQVENLQVRLSALQLLKQALADKDHTVAEYAREVLFEVADDGFQLGLTDEIVGLLESLRRDSDAERRKLRILVQDLLRYAVDRLTDTQKHRLEQLVDDLTGTSYPDRLRRWVGAVSLGDRILERNGEPILAEQVLKLADEGFANPTILDREMEWLASDAAENVVPFARRIGELDHKLGWFPRVLQVVTNKSGAALFAAYIEGRARAGATDWRQDVLDRLAADNPNLADAILEATWRGAPDDRGAGRIAGLLRAGFLQPSRVRLLGWGKWIKEVGLEGFTDLLGAVAEHDDSAATGAALILLEEWLSQHPESRQPLSTYAWRLLERTNRPVGSAEAEHSWRVVAEKYTELEPDRMVKSVLHMLRANDNASFHKTSSSVQLIAAATKAAPIKAWPLIARALKAHDRLSLKLGIALQGWYGELIDPDVLLEWAENNRSHGPAIVARLALVGGSPLPQLTRRLLIRYGDKEEIQGILHGNFVSGAWAGFASERYSTLLRQAESWLNDPAPQVRKWAEMVVLDLRKEIERLRTSEEEQGLRSSAGH